MRLRHRRRALALTAAREATSTALLALRMAACAQASQRRAASTRSARASGCVAPSTAYTRHILKHGELVGFRGARALDQRCWTTLYIAQRAAAA